jgi:hypothetical protein
LSPTPEDLEVRYRWLSIVVVVLFSASFTVGLVLYLVQPESPVSLLALHTGLVALLASPGVRMAVAAAERIRRRDWVFVVMMLVIAAEIAFVLWRAATKS